ncbi:RDD family protein [Streptomyces sp. TRM70350]|uniref:RDD family protein n=1 Tax=Streptomyces sp. TRM70350 TaxID=2856165 RepID=UPI001C44C488|nr:RDD family protein [Streptomyces sp. TRM70350]MBV7698924.1 RDD family protein [Streptomyces sp. TRM70350]
MSAPTPAPGDDRPREGYYPDPSIPGYVRYWNGAAWVPGTSRPAPADGEPLAPPPGVRPAQPAVEETGPHFFDEDPEPVRQDTHDARHGSRPEPASAWSADRSRQSGFGGDQDQRVSWPAAQGSDPRVPADPPAQPDGDAARMDGAASSPEFSASLEQGEPPSPTESGAAASGNTFVFRRPAATSRSASAGTEDAAEDPGTMTFRALTPRQRQQEGAAGAQGAAASGAPASGPVAAPHASGPAVPHQAASGGQGAPGWTASPSTPAQTPVGNSGGPGFGAGKAAAARAAAAQSAQATPPATVPHQAPATPAAPVTSGPGGGQSSWAQQVHRLAGTSGATPDEPVAPWKPPVEDPFQAAARRQAAARPAALGKRLAARLIDTLVIAGVTSVAAVPLGTQALDHIQGKIDEAKLSGQTVTVWLLDGTTSAYLAIVLGVLLLFGVVYEALPTAKWGRTLGKRLLGLEVRDIEAHEPPSFGAALRRWLVYSVPGLLCFGLIGVLWCLFDKPWRQCWHDKAAHTFVAG